MENKISEFNLLIASVGGQGGATLSRIIGRAAIKDGLKVVIGETFGMSQRFGIVQSYIRFGSNVYAPLIPDKKTNLLLGLEICESVRALKWCNKHTNAVIGNKLILPVYANLGIEKCPSKEELIRFLKSYLDNVCIVDTEKVAKKLGNPMLANTILLGYSYGLGLLPLSEKAILSAIEESLKAKYVELNKQAFREGIRMSKNKNVN
ncbi:MAG: indolepyruvate oxidoreductase subunit beta [Candidatus Odinarchaeota archaeon]|nr:indolepyruvate oxidoreductase subunit beta [Candidatus Odinarchaeota archaeon]